MNDVLEVDVGGGAARASVGVRHGEGFPDSAAAAARARAWLVLAERVRVADPASGAAACRRGLDELGRSYKDDRASIEDDTDMKVEAAAVTTVDTERVALLSRSLEARLQMYAYRYEGIGLTFEPPLE